MLTLKKMSKAKHVKDWRKRTKQRMVNAFGNICCVCKKSFPPELYDFHHIDGTKEFGLASAMANIISWKRLVGELKKCVMVCSNCHRLVEYGYKEVPNDADRFNEEFVDYNYARPRIRVVPTKKRKEYDECYCGNIKLKKLKYCSQRCSKIDRRTIERPSKEELITMVSGYGYCSVGRTYGVSDNAVRKWIKWYEKYE